MSYDCLALKDFFSLAIPSHTNGIQRGMISNIPIFYTYGESKQLLSNCQLHFDLISPNWNILITDPQNIIRFERFYPKWQKFSFNDDTRTLIISGTDNQTNTPYSLTITIAR